MTHATPLDPAAPADHAARTRRLLGHLTGALPARRGSAARSAHPEPVAPYSDADWWAGLRDGSAAVAPSTSATAGPVRTGAVPGPGGPVDGTSLAGVDGWLTARAGSGPAPDRTTVPVRVPVWPAWVGSTGTAPSVPTLPTAPSVPGVPAVAPAEPAVPPGARTVVRVSAARPAPVRAPIPAGGGVAPVVPPPAPDPAPDPAPRTDPAPRIDPAPDPAPRTDPAPDPAPRTDSAPRTDAMAGTSLLLTDGRLVALTTTLLVGRNPAPRAGETVGGLVAVADPARSVSKTHLTVGVDAGGAWVVDRHSTNGTVVTLPDGQRILCVPERRVRLVPGAAVGFGDHGFTLAAPADDERTR